MSSSSAATQKLLILVAPSGKVDPPQAPRESAPRPLSTIPSPQLQRRIKTTDECVFKFRSNRMWGNAHRLLCESVLPNHRNSPPAGRRNRHGIPRPPPPRHRQQQHRRAFCLPNSPDVQVQLMWRECAQFRRPDDAEPRADPLRRSTIVPKDHLDAFQRETTPGISRTGWMFPLRIYPLELDVSPFMSPRRECETQIDDVPVGRAWFFFFLSVLLEEVWWRQILKRSDETVDYMFLNFSPLQTFSLLVHKNLLLRSFFKQLLFFPRRFSFAVTSTKKQKWLLLFFS